MIYYSLSFVLIYGSGARILKIRIDILFLYPHSPSLLFTRVFPYPHNFHRPFYGETCKNSHRFSYRINNTSSMYWVNICGDVKTFLLSPTTWSVTWYFCSYVQLRLFFRTFLYLFQRLLCNIGTYQSVEGISIYKMNRLVQWLHVREQ